MARRLTLDYLKTESGSGLILAGAALGAILLANSPWAHRYFAFIGAAITVHIGAFDETQSVLKWVKDGLMAVVFLVVGMQVKFEVLRGELASYRRLGLPVLAALGGVAGPALVYVGLNLGPGGQPQGWPSAVATDIAFALAALAIASPRMPSALRVFLMTLALADDLAAVGLIGLLFTAKLHAAALAGAAATLGLLAVMGWWKRAPFLLYAAGFVLVWAFVLESGVNTSLAGVACAMTVPIGARRAGQESVLKFFMDSLHPYVAYGVLPLFAFCAAGFSFRGLTAADLVGPVPLGIAMALLVGKPLGILTFSLLAAATRVGRRPPGVTWLELAGAATLCGGGFTISLFVGALAFDATDPLAQSQVRLGVIAGSLLSAVVGGALLARAQAERTARGEDVRD